MTRRARALANGNIVTIQALVVEGCILIALANMAADLLQAPLGPTCATRSRSGKTWRMLDVLVDEWSLEARFPGVPPSDVRGRVAFEWMTGGKFLIQRWEVPIPDAPDGLAVIGFDDGRQTLLQHYFDSRGVARVYEMTLEGGVWTLSRTAPDFSPLPFSQRFTGRFSDDGMRIDGRWELARDGEDWAHDFDLVYTRAR